MCVYVCVHMRACVCMHICICMYMCVCTYAYVCMFVRMYVCVNSNILAWFSYIFAVDFVFFVYKLIRLHRLVQDVLSRNLPNTITKILTS